MKKSILLSLAVLLAIPVFAEDDFDEFDSRSSVKKGFRRYSSSIVYFGPSTLTLKEAIPALAKGTEFDGFSIGMSDLKWNRPVFTKFVWTYRSASATSNYDMVVDTSSGDSRYNYREQGSVETTIIMPEVSWSLETNILALSPIVESLPKFENTDLFLGAGFGINYAPFNMDLQYTSTHRTPIGTQNPPFANTYTKNKWYWHHITWNYHFIGGIMIDESLGGTVGIYTSEPFSGKRPRFQVQEIKFGVCYNF